MGTVIFVMTRCPGEMLAARRDPQICSISCRCVVARGFSASFVQDLGITSALAEVW